jgi:hypothetical protein
MEKVNSYGLYDRPVPGRVELALSQEALEQQLEDGAFVMDREEALQAGFLNPYNDDSVLVHGGETK